MNIKKKSSLIQLCTEASEKDECFTKGVWPAAGMGYVFVTENGRLLVIDGGQTRLDAERLIETLREKGGERPTVDLWIITHAHDDHYTALETILSDKELRGMIEIKKICAQADIPVKFPENDLKHIDNIRSICGCGFVEPHKGDIFGIDNLSVRIFHTWENDPKLEAVTTHNRLSMIFTVTNGRNGKRAMFVGDSTSVGPSVVRDSADPALLKSDFLQLAHHGLDGGDIGFYRMVAPETVLIPCSLGGSKFIKCPETACNYANRYISDRALSVICAHLGKVELDF